MVCFKRRVACYDAVHFCTPPSGFAVHRMRRVELEANVRKLQEMMRKCAALNQENSAVAVTSALRLYFGEISLCWTAKRSFLGGTVGSLSKMVVRYILPVSLIYQPFLGGSYWISFLDLWRVVWRKTRGSQAGSW